MKKFLAIAVFAIMSVTSAHASDYGMHGDVIGHHFVVNHVEKGSPADIANIKKGDMILKVTEKNDHTVIKIGRGFISFDIIVYHEG